MSASLPPPSSHLPSPSSSSGDHFKANNRSPQRSNTLGPQTPTSPPLMSVGAQSYAANLANPHTSPSHTTSNGQPLSSPSSTPMSTQNSQQPTVSATNSFPTPASSISGHQRNATPAEDSEAADKSWAQGTQLSTADRMDIDRTEHRRSDHDRDQISRAADVGGLPSSADADMMDIDSKAPRLDDPSIDALQKDLGTAFHLCKTGKVSLTQISFDCHWVASPRSFVSVR